MADIKTLREQMANIATEARSKLSEVTDATDETRAAEIEREALRSPAEMMLDLTWSPIGPTGVVSTWPSQWGVVSGRVRALAVHPTDPNTAYIGPAAGGIWKTTDGGDSWERLQGNGLPTGTLGKIAVFARSAPTTRM